MTVKDLFWVAQLLLILTGQSQSPVLKSADTVSFPEKSGRMLIIGGFEAERYHTEVHSLAVTDLGQGRRAVWQKEADLPKGLQGHTALVTGGYVMVFGGFEGFSPAHRPLFSKAVYAARLKDGRPGAWRQTATLPYPLGYHAAVTFRDGVYLSGGQSPTDVSAVIRGQLGERGEIESWSQVGALPRAMRGHGSVMVGKRLFILGGHDNGGYFAKVFSAEVDESGKLGTWRPAVSLPQPLVHFGVAEIHGRIYVFGGQDVRGKLHRAVYSSGVKGDQLSPWRREKSFAHPQARMGITVWGDTVVASGGGYGWGPPVYSAVWTSVLQRDGRLGKWRKALALPFPLAFHAALLID